MFPRVLVAPDCLCAEEAWSRAVTDKAAGKVYVVSCPFFLSAAFYISCQTLVSQSPDNVLWHDGFEQPWRADRLHELIQLHWGTSVALMFGDASGDLGLAVLHLRPVVEYQAR